MTEGKQSEHDAVRKKDKRGIRPRASQILLYNCLAPNSSRGTNEVVLQLLVHGRLLFHHIVRQSVNPPRIGASAGTTDPP